jgi:hypothetical protein
MPAGSRRAITTPAVAVTVSRSPRCQPSTRVMARPGSGRAGQRQGRTSGLTSAGRRRTWTAADRMTGAMSWSVMAASLPKGTGTSQHARGSQAASTRVQAVSVLGRDHPVWCPRRDLNSRRTGAWGCIRIYGTRPDRAVSVPGRQPGDIREHPDTSAPVSREVSADACDGPLSELHSGVDDLGVWLPIWSARNEPDAGAHRCASDAVDAIDGLLRPSLAV